MWGNKPPKPPRGSEKRDGLLEFGFAAPESGAMGKGDMFTFAQGVPALTVWAIWLAVFAGLFVFNEIARRWK